MSTYLQTLGGVLVGIGLERGFVGGTMPWWWFFAAGVATMFVGITLPRK